MNHQTPTHHLYSLLHFIGFLLIRFFENILFYKPFLKYSQKWFDWLQFPEISYLNLTASPFYILVWILAFLSGAYGLLLKTKITSSLHQFATCCIHHSHPRFLHKPSIHSTTKTTRFCVRRFLIHPLFLRLFIAVFFTKSIQIDNFIFFNKQITLF